jgi:hypothetical protein
MGEEVRIRPASRRLLKKGRRETTEQTEATEITEFDLGIESRVFSEQRYLEGP